jgi:sterol desaturase/sphingolipid hydroxylase (fatty acid hydroxylase superfamily)
MDWTFYWWHRANHQIPLLWRFHNIHHIDPDLDVTTSFRFHFVEILYSTLFKIFQVGLIGILPITYIVYELVFTCATIFHHSNFRLPLKIERLLNKIIVTPRMHGIHHSVVKDETNSNFSVVFRFWDYLHKTLRLNVHQSKILVGIAGYQQPYDNNLWDLIILPFKKQKDYWSFADGSEPLRDEEKKFKYTRQLAE